MKRPPWRPLWGPALHVKQERGGKAEVSRGRLDSQAGQGALRSTCCKMGVSGSVVKHPHPAQWNTVEARLGPQCYASVCALSAGRCMGSPACYHSSGLFVLGFFFPIKKDADFKGNI